MASKFLTVGVLALALVAMTPVAVVAEELQEEQGASRSLLDYNVNSNNQALDISAYGKNGFIVSFNPAAAQAIKGKAGALTASNQEVDYTNVVGRKLLGDKNNVVSQGFYFQILKNNQVAVSVVPNNAQSIGGPATANSGGASTSISNNGRKLLDYNANVNNQALDISAYGKNGFIVSFNPAAAQAIKGKAGAVTASNQEVYGSNVVG